MALNNLLAAGSLLLLLASCWNRHSLPARLDVLDALAHAPRQSATERAPFDVTFNEGEYRVEPEYAYELTGLVVSFRHHDGNSRLHRLAEDHLNMLDVCVVWGDNVTNGYLHEFAFENGIFTCNYRTRSDAAWAAFDESAVSNNHLLSADPTIRRQLADLEVGDQLRVRGLLASYTSGNGSRRGTSTTREDRGDGACETIWVESFELLRPATNPWHAAFWLALGMLACTLTWHFTRPYRPHRSG